MHKYALETEFGARLVAGIDRLATPTRYATAPDAAADLATSVLGDVFDALPLPPGAEIDAAARRVHAETLAVVRAIGEPAVAGTDRWLVARRAHERLRTAQLEMLALLRVPGEREATPADCAQFAGAFGDDPTLRPDIRTAADAGDYNALFTMVQSEYAAIVRDLEKKSAPARETAAATLDVPSKLAARQPIPPVRRARVPSPPFATTVAVAARPPITVRPGAGPGSAVAVIAAPTDWLSRVRDQLERALRTYGTRADLWWKRIAQSESDVRNRQVKIRADALESRIAQLTNVDASLVIRLQLIRIYTRNDVEEAQGDWVVEEIVGDVDVRAAGIQQLLDRTSPSDTATLSALVGTYVAAVRDERLALLGRPLETASVFGAVTSALSGALDALAVAAGGGVDRIVPVRALDNSAATTVSLAATPIAQLTAEAFNAPPTEQTATPRIVTRFPARTAFIDADSVPDDGAVYVRAGNEWRREYPVSAPVWSLNDPLLDQIDQWEKGFAGALAPYFVSTFFSNANVPETERIARLPQLAQYVGGVGILRVDAESGATRIYPGTNIRSTTTFADRVNDALETVVGVTLNGVLGELSAAVSPRPDVSAGARFTVLPPSTTAAYARARLALAVVLEQMQAVRLEEEYVFASLLGQVVQDSVMRLIEPDPNLLRIEDAPSPLPSTLRQQLSTTTPIFSLSQAAAQLAFWRRESVIQARRAQSIALRGPISRVFDRVATAAVAGESLHAFGGGTVTLARLVRGELLGVDELKDKLLLIDQIAVSPTGDPKTDLARRMFGRNVPQTYRRATLLRDLCDSARVNVPNCNRWTSVETLANVNWNTTSEATFLDYGSNTVANVRIYDPQSSNLGPTLLRAQLPNALPTGASAALVASAIATSAVPIAAGEAERIESFMQRLIDQRVDSWVPSAVQSGANLADALFSAQRVYPGDVDLHRSFALLFPTLETLAFYTDIAAKVGGLVALQVPQLGPRLAALGTSLRTCMSNLVEVSWLRSMGALVGGAIQNQPTRVTTALDALKGSAKSALGASTRIVDTKDWKLNKGELAESVGYAGISLLRVANVGAQFALLVASLIGQFFASFAVALTPGSANVLSGVAALVLNTATVWLLALVWPTINDQLLTFLKVALLSALSRGAAIAVARPIVALVRETTIRARGGALGRSTRSEALAEAALLGASLGAAWLAPVALQTISYLATGTPTATASALGDFVRVPSPAFDGTDPSQTAGRAIELVTVAGSALGRLAAPGVAVGLARLLARLMAPGNAVVLDEQSNARYEAGVADAFSDSFIQRLKTDRVPVTELFPSGSQRSELLVVWQLVFLYAIATRDRTVVARDSPKTPTVNRVGTQLLAHLREGTVVRPRLVELSSWLDGAQVLLDPNNAAPLPFDTRVRIAAALTSERNLEFARSAIRAASAGVNTADLLLEVISLYRPVDEEDEGDDDSLSLDSLPNVPGSDL